jgi:Flp pilus assembly protein TadG
MRRRPDQRGSASVDLACLLLPITLLILTLVALGRTADADLDLEGAAWDAARAASTRRSMPAAVTAAEQAAEDGMDGQCAALEVQVDTSNFAPGGRVVVELACTVGFSDLSGLRSPGVKVLRARGIAVIDAFRGAG